MSESKYSKLSTLQYRMTKVLEEGDDNKIREGFLEMKELLKPTYPLIQFFKKQIIYKGDQGGILFFRWNLIGCKLFMLRLHKFCSSDHDCLHDHPWNFCSFILKNGYYEKTEKGLKFYSAFNFLYRPAEWKHSVQLKNNKPAWTLVLSFRVRRQWGFWVGNLWTHWTKFNSKNICE